MTRAVTEYAPVSGSCTRCGCALGYGASRRGETWYCCGECSEGDVCVCGCRPGHHRNRPSDLFVPSRRMFAARHPDYLKTPRDFVQTDRAFPFADRIGGNTRDPARRRP